MELFVQANSKTNIKKLSALGIQYIAVGMEHFSLRQALTVSYEELATICTLPTHIYVLVNALVEQKYLPALSKHLETLASVGIAGVLFQDFSVLQIVKENEYPYECIYAPDTLNTNFQTLRYLHTEGVSGAYLAREIPLSEKLEIQKEVNMPCFIQIHGVEYMAHSKRNLLQNYLDAIDHTTDHNQHVYTVEAKNAQPCYIYQDSYGTHMVTKGQLTSVDVLDQMGDIAFGVIESLYMKEQELLDIVTLYQEALRDQKKDTYKPEEYVLALEKIQPNVTYTHSFLFDQTVYKMEDVRKREANEKCK